MTYTVDRDIETNFNQKRPVLGTRNVSSDNMLDNARPRLVNSMETQSRWLKWMGIGPTLLGCIVLPIGVMFDDALGLTIGAMSLIIGVIFVFVWLVSGYFTKKYDTQLRRIESGEYLAHWTYEMDEWRAYIETERSEHKDTWWILAIILGAVGLFIGGGWAFFNPENTIADSHLLTAFIPTLVGASMGGMLGFFVQGVTNWKLDRIQDNPEETYIGLEGLYFKKQYNPWHLFGQSLEDVALDDERQPAVIRFSFSKQGGESNYTDEINVPVPSGREVAAAAIVATLTRQSDDSRES